MDTVNNWKRILLQWIKECNFLEKPFYNIEQSEVEAFFNKFKNHIKGDYTNKDLSSFLREHYPLYEPHFDDENALSSSDYVYVYSLLLHFSCVKCPDEFFQKNCQKLNESAQQNIATFFKKLLEANYLTKETLRHAIASITLFPPPTSTRLVCIESPMKTPRKTEISPPTPRSCMLQERNRELHNLKVQLENEVYEKGVLEIEVKQNQEKILKLSRELKKSHQEIQNLRNDILSRTAETDSDTKHSEEEQLNRRLCKQISQKEVEIAQQRDDIDTLTEQKDILKEKLDHAEKQMKLFQNKIEELAQKVDELTTDLEQKDLTVQYLSEAKLELEHYISEIRSSSASSRPDLNISAECLDLSRTTNSSGSLNSPENLGCSVVDIQLREKENENIQLREEIAGMRLNNSKLSKYMNDLTVRYSDLFNTESLIINKKSVDPIENFIMFSSYVEKFVHKYEENCVALNELKKNNKILGEQNSTLSSKVDETENKISCLRKQINDLELNNKSLIMVKANLENAVSEWKNKLEICSKERVELERSLENLQKEIEKLRNIKNCSDQASVEKIKYFSKKLEETEKESKNLRVSFENNNYTLTNLEAELTCKNEQIQKLISEIKQQSVDFEQEKNNIKIQFQHDLSALKDKLLESSNILSENEIKIQQFKSEKQELQSQVFQLQSEYRSKEQKLLKYIDTESQLQEKNTIINAVENENKKLLVELSELKQNLDFLLNEKNQFAKKVADDAEVISSLKKTLRETEEALLKSADSQNQLNWIITRLQNDKETLINLIQEKIEILKISIDQHENIFKDRILSGNKETADVMDKLALTETEFKLSKEKLEDICFKYNDIKEAINRSKGQFSKFISKLTIHLQMIIGKMDDKTFVNEFKDKELMFSVSLEDFTDDVEDFKQCLNELIKKSHQLTSFNTENEEQVISLTKNVRKLMQQKSDLEHKLVLSESDLQCEKNKLCTEVKRLNDNIANLENVCDHLTEENSTLQIKLSELKAINEELTQENRLLEVKTSVLEADRANQLSMADKLINTETELRAQVSNMQSSVKKLEMDIEAVQRLLLVKTRDSEMLLEERNQAKNSIESLKKQIEEFQSKVILLEIDLKKMTEKYEVASKLIEENHEEQFKKLKILKVQLESEVNEKSRISEKLDDANEQLNELTNQKIVLENKCKLLDKQLERLKSDLGSTKKELVRLQCEETKLLGEIELIKETKFSSEEQVEKCNKEIFEQKENLSGLIKEITSIRKEKDAVEEEKNFMLKCLEERNSAYSSLDLNYKSILEKLQIAEKELLAKQNCLKSEQLKSQDLENQLTKLQMENIKLKETGENHIKRMEKQALKLGETQAKTLRLKKEAEAAQANVEALKSSSESAQRESFKLNMECKSLKEKLFKSEKAFDQLELKLQTLEKENKVLRSEKENIETSENELKSTNAILEKSKINLEDKVRKLAKSLSDSNVAVSRLEQDKVQLNLEIGGLNKQLQENKSLLSMRLKEIEDVTNNFVDATNSNTKLMELNEKLQVDANKIREENSRLNDQLSKLELRLQIMQEGYANTKAELETLRASIDIKKNERDAVEKEHMTTKGRLKAMELLVEERHSTELEFIEKIKCLEGQLSEVSSNLLNSEETRKQEKLINEKLNTDISILQAKLQKSRLICEENEKKWNEEKEQLLVEVKSSDERIKETRLELEGKLEKMKNKMKTLYNDEITKMKKKQEREMAVMKSELDALKIQNDKYEEHTKKLSSQIFRLNENILEHQKQNTFLKTKLKDLENKPRQLNRIATTHTSQPPGHQALPSNLHMEDEEGEVFNNTYLSDLKNGRMSELFSRDICPQELQYRNSLLPPHLKSTYLAQFDHQMGEDEIRDTPSLDDSLSTLLNTGQRKKVSGATSYKRPGPPTPSKNAGRLSFGGNGEPNREILKETLDMGNGPSSSKTPAKFKLFSSRLSMKDERKTYLTTFKRKQHILGTQCSSTPRKSKAHFDQRRLLDQIIATASSNREDSVDSAAKELLRSPKSPEFDRRMSEKWRHLQSFRLTDSEISDVTSPVHRDVKYESASKRVKRFNDRRGSIYLRGSMFARNCRTPNLGFREVFKNKLKLKRNANFNKHRSAMFSQLHMKKTSIASSSLLCDKPVYFMETMSAKNNTSNIHVSYPHNTAVIENTNTDKSLEHFQKLLIKKESQAPFEINDINCPSYSKANSSSTVHSRTIYGASVILNRRIPNVNTTLVRKSSIYVKASDEDGIILVTNQTITLADLAQMWMQMNISAKMVTGLSLAALFVAIFSFVIQLIL